MSEFKLERFKYNWEGDWVANTNYNRDSIVRYGGKSYVCLLTHTSATNFYNDLYRILPGSVPPQAQPYWTEMTVGKSFVGNWAPTTFYREGDIVLHTGSLWKCVGSHTSSAFETNQSDWELFANGLGFEALWQSSTNYGPGALVTYNGNVYKCITAHTSQTILEDNESAWEIFFEGVSFVGNWTPSTLYRKNNYVKYGGSIFLCINTHTSDGVFNDNNFQLELPGFQFDGEWSPSAYYQVGDVVRRGGYLYYAITNNTNNSPSSASVDSTEAWTLMLKSYNFRGTWSADSNQEYYTGDIVRRGGQTLICVKDILGDGSTLDYEDDDVFWETLIPGRAWRQEWSEGEEYSVGDVVNFYGDIYSCNTQHFSFDNNYPGDNGSGYEYWDFLAQAGTEAGMRLKGDLLTYDYKGRIKGDLSTLGPAPVPATRSEDLLSIIERDRVAYRTYGEAEELVIYVSQDGIDRPGRGLSMLKPFATIRYALEYLEDNVPVTTPKKVKIATGQYYETCPMVVPAYCVVMGDELRSTTITANVPDPNWENEQLNFTVEGINRVLELLPNLFTNTSLEKHPDNPEDPVYDPAVISNNDTVSNVESLVTTIIATIEYNTGSGGFQPDVVGTNDLTNSVVQLNAATILNSNKEFLINEFILYIRDTFPQYSNFNAEWLRMKMNSFIRAWAYDLRYPGTYASILAGRRYANSVLGSRLSDMFYLRDITGVRNCTLKGLEGSLNPPGVFDIYQRPTGGAFCSLDPGWGPDDDRGWIKTRSPYIQGVTTIGSNCVGQKVDGALHNGGNKSFVSNDFTQVLSDGIGAWILNNGRAELVSVFTYYCQVGYLAEDGGVMRATNGNNSYGTYGAIADGIDENEPTKFITLNTRNNQAVVATAFAGEVTDEIQIFEFSHCGEEYTQANALITGAGNFADTVFEDFRDGGMFQARLIPPADSGSVGGSGFLRASGNAQSGTATTLTLSGTDSTELPAKYIGMRIILTSGDGTGQYGYIQNYNPITKVATIYKESDNTPGWDHVIAGTPAAVLLTTNTQYSIEPRIICSDPGFQKYTREFDRTRDWQDIAYGNTTATYENILVGPGTGETVDVTAAAARFTITRRGEEYVATMLFEGLGYAVGDVVTILGTDLGGDSPANDCRITIDSVTDDSSNSIVTYSVSGTAKTGVWVAVAPGDRITFSEDGNTWEERLTPADANWSKVQPGDNAFVAMRSGSSNTVIRSLDGATWVQRNLPITANFVDIAFGDGVFVMIAEGDNRIVYSTNGGVTWRLTAIPDSTVGDSTENQWQSITYGRGQFLAVSGSTNSVATSEDGITWTLKENVLPGGLNTYYDWTSVAYGRGRYVALSKNNAVSAISVDDGTTWRSFASPTLDGSTAQHWQEIKYANGLFTAVMNVADATEGSDLTGRTYYIYQTEDGITWKERDTELYKRWKTCAYGKKDGMGQWVFLPEGPDFVMLYAMTGAAPRLRAQLNAGIFSDIRIWDPGSGFTEDNLPEITVFDTQYVLEITTENRIANGVLAQPTFLNRGLGYRTSSTRVEITGNGYADIIPAGNQIVVDGLTDYPGPGAQLLFENILDDETEDPNDKKLFVAVIITPLGSDGNGGLRAALQISPSLKIDDFVYHGLQIQRRDNYSQCRISGHDFLDIGTGNFEETNYPDLYAGGAYFTSAPENEVTELNGGRVFYTSTDQDGNFRAGELFSVQQSTGIVTISAEYFDLDGLSELALGGVRLGGSGTVIREFSTDPNFTEDSNNVIPTQRAVSTFLANRLSEGGSELETNTITAGVVRVGTSENIIDTTTDTIIRIPVMANFDGEDVHIQGMMVAQMMFLRSFSND